MLLFYWLITTMPFMKHPFWAHYVGELTMTKYLGGGCALYALVYLARRRRPPRYLASAPARWFLVFMMLVLISFAHGAPFTWQSQMVSYVSFAVLFFVTLTVVDSLRRLRWVLLVCIGSVAWASLYTIREWQQSIRIYGLSYRPGWVSGDPNYFAVCAVIAVPLCLVLISNPLKRWDRYYALGCVCMTLFALMISASRGGFLGLLVACVGFAWNSRRRVLVLSSSAVLVVLFMLLSPSSPLDRFLHPSSGDNTSSELRLQLWTSALNMVRAHPLAGVGLGNFGDQISRYGKLRAEGAHLHVTHNTYLHLAAELGVPGLLAFVLVLISTLRFLGAIRKRARSQSLRVFGDVARGIHSGLLGMSVAAFFLSAQLMRFIWLVFFISWSLNELVGRKSTALKTAVPETRKIEAQPILPSTAR